MLVCVLFLYFFRYSFSDLVSSCVLAIYAAFSYRALTSFACRIRKCICVCIRTYLAMFYSCQSAAAAAASAAMAVAVAAAGAVALSTLVG